MTIAIVDLREWLAGSEGSGPLWTASSTDLNVNLLRFDGGRGVPEHRNDEVDVLIVAIAGEGVIEVEGEARPIRQGQLCLIPKGARRAIRSAGSHFAYLTCHRRRAGLWPAEPEPRTTG